MTTLAEILALVDGLRLSLDGSGACVHEVAVHNARVDAVLAVLRDYRPDNDVLTAALPFVELAAEEQQSYGYFLADLVGGDPRQFSPDEECATPAEIAQHKADCEAWDRGERPVHRVLTPIDPARSIARQLKGSDSAMLERDGDGNVTGGHVHRAGYGLGVTSFRDPAAVDALAKLRAALPAGDGKEVR